MEKNGSKILMGAIYTHLIHILYGKKLKIWKSEQIGGSQRENCLYPHVTIIHNESRAWRSVTFDGEHHRVTLEIMTQKNCTRENAIDYSNDVIGALHSADFQLKGRALIEIQHEQAEYNKIADNDSYLVSLLFTVLTVID